MELDGVIQAARRLQEEIQAALEGAPPTAELDPMALFHDDEGSRGLAVAAPSHATELLLDEAVRVEHEDPARAALLLALAAGASTTGDDVASGLALARRARRVAARADAADAPASARLSEDVLVSLTGEGRPAQVPEELSGVSDLATLHQLAALYVWNEDYRSARRVAEQAVDLARREARSFLPVALDTLALIDSRTGRWSAAAARSLEALRLAVERGQSWQAGSCASTLAWLAAATGRDDECRRRATQALELAPGSELVFGWATAALGFLELSLDRPDAAIEELEKITIEAPFSTTALNWLPLLVEGYVRTGRMEDARTTHERLEAQARATRHAGTLALAARCRGLLASPHEYALHFEEALELHLRVPTPFERARTELLFGERLRRGRHRGEARPMLQSALATFERLGAVRWARRARRELEGLRRRQPAPDGIEAHLTAHELQVVALVGRGATNREAAAALFVTPKTIEYHLRNIYAKLGVRSRTELALLVARA